jgi:hypothetical protein
MESARNWQIVWSSVRPLRSAQVFCASLSRILLILAIPILLGSLLQSCGGGGGGAPVTNLKSITIDPVNPSIGVGTKVQLHATGIFKNKTTKDLTESVTWESGNAAVAIVSNKAGTKGLAGGSGVGATTVDARFQGIKGVSTFTVTKVSLQSITVEPVNPRLAKGTTVQMAAQGNFSDGSVQNLTTQVSWSSGNSGIATVSNTAGTMGLVTGVSVGNTPITATFGTIAGLSTVTVTAATVASISIIVPVDSIAKGTMVQLHATCVLSDRTTEDCTNEVTWSSSNSGIAQVSDTSPTKGLVTGVGVGDSTISGSFGGMQGSAVITVTTETLSSITVAPPNPSFPKGTQQPLTATGNFSDGSTKDLTTQVSWSQDDDAIAEVSNITGSQGLVTGLSVGNTLITAALNGVEGSTTVNVTAAVVTSITVTAPFTSIPVGHTESPLTANCHFSDSTTKPCTDEVSWTSGDNSIAVVSSISPTQGEATGKAVGSTSIIATVDGVQGTGAVNVTPAVLESITVSPLNSQLPNPPVIAKTFSVQLVANCNYSDGTVKDCTTLVDWSPADHTFVSVSNTPGSQGLATGLAATTGKQIFATDPATLIQGSTTVTVTAATLTSISVAPVPPTAPLKVAVGFKLPLAATCFFSDGTSPDCTSQVSWKASGPATVDSNGVVTGTAPPGSANITASLSGVTSTPVTVTVTGAVLQSITIAPTSSKVAKGLTQQLVATCTFNDGSTNPNCSSQVFWHAAPIAPGNFVTVDANGLVTGTAPGVATITASQGSVGSNSVTVTVSAAVVTGITITPSNLTLTKNEKVQMIATATLSDGTTLDLTTQVSWQTCTMSPPAPCVSADHIVHINNTKSSQTNGELMARGVTDVSTATVTGTFVNPDGTTVTSSTLVTVNP